MIIVFHVSPCFSQTKFVQCLLFRRIFPQWSHPSFQVPVNLPDWRNRTKWAQSYQLRFPSAICNLIFPVRSTGRSLNAHAALLCRRCHRVLILPLASCIESISHCQPSASCLHHSTHITDRTDKNRQHPAIEQEPAIALFHRHSHWQIGIRVFADRHWHIDWCFTQSKLILNQEHSHCCVMPLGFHFLATLFRGSEIDIHSRPLSTLHVRLSFFQSILCECIDLWTGYMHCVDWTATLLCMAWIILCRVPVHHLNL